jgi:hypothetical protein
MITHMTTGRYDGREWPDYNEIFDVPEWEAEHLVGGGNAEYPDKPPLDRGFNVLKAADTDYESKLDRVGGEEADVYEPEVHRPDTSEFDFDSDFDRDDSDSEVSEPEMKRPAVADKKAAWIEWAVHNGANGDAAEESTKAALIEEYGSL